MNASDAYKFHCSEYGLLYLECRSGGHNKFYRMEHEKGTLTWKATYGPIGKSGAIAIYPTGKWTDKLMEKFKKGYDLVLKVEHLPPAVPAPQKPQLNDDYMNRIKSLLEKCDTPLFRSNGYERLVREAIEEYTDTGKLTQAQMKTLNDVYRRVVHGQ